MSLVGHTNPKLVHFREIQLDEINRILDLKIPQEFTKMSDQLGHDLDNDYISVSLSGFWAIFRKVREQVSCALQKIVSQEKASKGVLNSSTHLNQIPQNVPPGLLICLDVNHTNCDQKITEKK